MSNPGTKKYIEHIEKIGHYSHNSTTDMICFGDSGKKVLVEIEYKLSNIFKHEHPYETFDYIVCWLVDLDINEKKTLKDGTILSLIKEDNNWVLKHGAQKIIPIIELKHLTNTLEKRQIGRVTC
ncbi:hypothetical protein [Desnuesiella massiliensis]|uniref:hypothetical protein n=1 Tax=Desnuesiella massiliensis TaxID=1650662 RepID=UPI0006E2F523|nr:hypothetical protein [Desnuesiella massiliensis]